jgi:hypothetical protein
MLLSPGSLSECFLTRKMDYTGNSISNKISIYLKEFQDFYWEYFAAVFPLWFTAAFSPSCLEYTCSITPASREQKDGACLHNLKKGKFPTKAILSNLKNQPHFCKIDRYKGNPEIQRACCAMFQLSQQVEYEWIAWTGTNLFPGSDVC